MPCPSTGPKIFCEGPNFLSQPKNVIAFRASSKTFVPALKTKFTESFDVAQNVWDWQKMYGTGKKCISIFGPAQKIWTSPKYFGTCRRTRHNSAPAREAV